MIRFKFAAAITVLGIAMTAAGNIAAEKTTALFDGAVVNIENTLADPIDLWVSPEDLTRVTGLVLKPEGACVADICIPVKQDTDSNLFVKRLGKQWVNATALAAILGQSVVADRDANVWSFGQVPAVRASSYDQGVAPDFALNDREGNTVRLSDYRGKKVIIMTWASW
jgi:AhpC/TSA family